MVAGRLYQFEKAEGEANVLEAASADIDEWTSGKS